MTHHHLHQSLTSPCLLTLAISLALAAGNAWAADAPEPDVAEEDAQRVTVLTQDDDADDEAAPRQEEVVVVGTQIKGAAISDALAVSIVDSVDIEALGISSGDELLDYLPEQGQNTFNEVGNIAGGVNSARGDIGAFNLRNMGTGNTLVLLNGRRMVNAAGYQTEAVGGSLVPVNSPNTTAMPVFGIDRLEVLRDGASAIYGADAVAGVLNTVLKNDFEGFTVSIRQDEYDNVPRNDQRVNLEWGQFFNGGRTNVGVFADFYNRDRVNSSDDERWFNPDYRRYLVGTPWEGMTSWRNDSANAIYGQFDIIPNINPVSNRDRYGLVGNDITDTAGEFDTYPIGDPGCEGGFALNAIMCGNVDSLNYRYNLNENQDLVSDLERYNLFMYINHEMGSGVEAFTEVSWYEASTNLIRSPSTALTSSELVMGAQNYYNPLGPCGSPNRLPDSIIGTEVPCSGLEMYLDNYRFAEYPRIVANDNHTWRFLQGFRGSKGKWDWETALVLSEAKRNDVTHNRISNTLMQNALNDPTPAAYNPFSGGLGGSNIEQALIDVYRKNKTDLQLVDFKISTAEFFDLPAGPVGFLAGVEYREESFVDDRDPRLDGTVIWTDNEGDTYPFVSDVLNSSPTADSRGSRDVTSLFAELAIPVFESLDIQLAARYEDFSDVGSTTVGKFAFGWRPVDPFLLRGSWSEAFRAPNLITVNEELVVRNNTRTDWACIFADPNEDVLDCNYSMQRRARGSQDLVAETSTNTSVGFVWDITDALTVTLDYWTIEKDDTIGLFGEENHTILDLLLRQEAGLGSCAGVGNPAVEREEANEEEIAAFTAAGICPAGDVIGIDDNYANFDTRTIEGHDLGIYYDFDTRLGDFRFKYNGTFYDKYEQTPGGRALLLLEAQAAGDIPSNFPVRGFDDLMGVDGNYDNKHNANLRWFRNDWGASLSMFKVGSFHESAQTLSDGTRWIIPSMTTYNASVDYDFEMFKARSRIRLGIINLTDERAPLADESFGYWADVHRDLGRSWYLDLRMQWD